MRLTLFAALALAAIPAASSAQPFNVRAWYTQGQVFVVWQFPAPPAAPTDTVEIYVSPGAQPDTSMMQQVGRLFFPEYTGGRLRLLDPAARLLVPVPGGGTYRLNPDEGAFVFTPHLAGNLFFAVVDTGSTAVVPANSDATNFLYDPVNDPVVPHPQYSGATSGGNPFTAYVVWADGRADYNDSRPDFPVTASARRNGVPHVFTVTLPTSPLPPGPLSCLFAIHGGEGEYQVFRPGMPARANMSLELDDGIVVTPDDTIFTNHEGALLRSGTSWFGYTSDLDPFDAGARTTPPDAAVVVNYTQRRVFWILDSLLRPNSPYSIDPERVAMVGHSAGGRGASHLTRLHPERFCAAVCYNPATNLAIDAAGRANYLQGNWDQNLATNISLPDVGILGVTDVHTPTTRLSTQRDFALTRFFYGKRDEGDSPGWNAGQRAILDSLNDCRAGYMIFWDEREHGVDLWDTDENDATDDPAHTNPWPDIGQWVAPVRTYRSAGQYLVDAYRASQSFPAFANADDDPVAAGRQPDPGPGDPDLGDPYGAWGGYFDWDAATISDLPGRWACTIFVTGLSAVSIDNSPVAEITADVIPRKTQRFQARPGLAVHWTANDAASGVLVQSGVSIVEEGGIAAVIGLRVPRDPARIRLTLVTCPADFNADGAINSQDFFDFVGAFFAQDPSADANGDGDVNSQDFFDFVVAFFVGCSA